MGGALKLILVSSNMNTNININTKINIGININININLILIRRHPWLSSVWKQPGSPGPMEPECHKPMSHWSQVVKGTTTGAIWLRVVTPYPLGTPSGPSTFPYGSLMVPLRPPYGPL